MLPRNGRLVAAILALAVAVAGCGGDDEGSGGSGPTRPDAVVRIGTKDFTEQFVLGELYRQALVAKGFRVVLKPDIGSTELTHQALRTGGIDMYPEYLGVLLSEVAKRRDRPSDPDKAYRVAKTFEERTGYTLLGMTPFSDQNVLVVKPALARKHRLRTIADLDRIPGRVELGAPPEFRTRYEGLVGLRARYGLPRVRAVPIPIGEQYRALSDGEVHVAAAFSTSGALADGGFVALRDPRKVFAIQRVAPVISRKALRAAGPGLAPAIDAVSRALTTAVMREMNAAVDEGGQSPRVVAARFLRARGLLRP